MKSIGLITAFALTLAAPAYAGEGNTITIGFTVSQTGALNVDSIAQRNGFDLWREDVNKAGGIRVGGKQYEIGFASYDDQSQSPRVQQLYTRLILQDKADFLFSPYSSGLTATAAIISEQYGKIMLTTGAAEDNTYKLGNKDLFQIYTPASHYLTSALDVEKQRNPKAKIAFVYSDDAFSKAVIAAARTQAKERGLNVVLDEAYAPSTDDFGLIINQVISSGADALMGGGHYADGATLARQLHDHNAKLDFISLLVAPDSPQFASLGDAAIDVTVPSQWEPQVSYEPQFGPTAPEFTKEYKAKFGAEPGYHAAGGYAAGLILQHAIEKADSLDAQKVAAALNATDATVFFGRIKFALGANDHGLQVGHAMVLAQWQKKGRQPVKQVVWPKAAETAQLVYPTR
jgi:branched-chain amino acid transport system substrate-binding protein